MREILVSIICDVFNHEPYLRQCLDGFVMQKTNFEFEVLIHDDASTDGSVGIIHEYIDKYPNINWRPIFQERNQFSQGVGIWRDIQFPRANGKYIALCEGDDYWTDPLKLQKQVDFMESHPEYLMCFHRCQTLMSQTGEIVDEFIVPDMPGESSIEDLSKGNYIHTLSVVYRRNDDVQKKIASLGSCMPGDYVLWMMNAEKGKIWKFEEPMGVYRYGSGTWTKNSSIDNDLQYLITLTKLWMVVNNPIAKKHLQEQIKNQRRMIDSLERSERNELISVRSSKAYRLGKLLLKPFKWFNKK